jgi:hypothetical protein
MILKIQKGGQFLGVIRYNEEKVAKGEANLLENSTFANSVKGKAKAFLDVTDLNKKVTKNKVVHLSISLPKTDKLTDREFLNIVDQYRQHLGYSETPSLVYRHYDKEHAHVHVIFPSVDFNGKKISDYNDHRKGEELSRQLELKHGLTLTINKSVGSRSLGEINKERFSIINALRKIEEDVEQKKQVASLTGQPFEELLSKSFDNYTLKQQLKHKFTPLVKYLQNEFLLIPSKKEQLVANLIKIYKDSTSAEDFHNRINKAGLYSRIIAKGGKNTICYGDPGSAIYVNEGKVPQILRYGNVHIPGQNYQNFHSQQSSLRRLIRRCVRSSRTPDELSEKLKQNAVLIEYAQNARGIYGVSFTSTLHETPIKFKGSDLGKDFSWNTIYKVLEINSTLPSKNINTINQSSLPLNLGRFAYQLDDEDKALQRRKRKARDDEENEQKKGI